MRDFKKDLALPILPAVLLVLLRFPSNHPSLTKLRKK